MKVRKALSGILLGLGCAIAFIGLLALILPAISNAQLQLVLASFAQPSSQPLVSAINRGMSFALSHGWQVLFIGLFLLLIGVSLFVLFSVRESPQNDVSAFYRRAEENAFSAKPLWEPRPETRPNPFADMAKWDSFAPVNSGGQDHAYAFARYSSPLLEPNRIEPAPIHDQTPWAKEALDAPAVDSWERTPPHEAAPFERPAPTAEPNPFARPASVPAADASRSPAPAWEPALKPLARQELSQTSDPSPDHMTFARSPARSHFPQNESLDSPEGENVYTPNEEEAPQSSSRIRSTMGQHREW